MKYQKLSVDACLCAACLEEAARGIGPSFQYDLHVASNLDSYARRILHEIAAEAKTNPFAPWINLHIDSGLEIYEWYIEANGKAIGSPGIK